jgi:hypothetical protein
MDAGLDAVYESFVVRLFSLSLFSFLIFQSGVALAADEACKYILLSPFLRNDKTLQRKIFAPGDALLREFFYANESRARLPFLSLEQKTEFVSKKKEKIIQILTEQETNLEAIGKSEGYFSVSGGNSRVGRFATAFKKVGVNVFLDLDLVDSSALYMHDYKTVVLGLEEALYPNELSLNLLHVAQHVAHYERTLVIPVINDKVSTKTLKSFSLDEVLVYEKEISLMKSYKKVKIQNTHLRVQSSKVLKIRPSLDLFRELSMRVLLKKYELLKIVNFLKKIEKDTSLLQNEDFISQFEELAPEVILDIHAFELMEFYPGSIQKKARGSIDLIEKAIRVSEAAFE